MVFISEGGSVPRLLDLPEDGSSTSGQTEGSRPVGAMADKRS